ncbi:hypothetical protein D3C81_1955220 [compost metagenome]
MRGQPDDEAFRPGQQAASGLSNHVSGFWVFAEQPGLIDQHANGFLAAHHVTVGGDHLQRGTCLTVSDQPKMGLHMQQVLQFIVVVDHVLRRHEGVVGNLFSRGKDDELG